MSPLWRAISISAASAAILAGTALLMGSLHGSGDRSVQLEQARVEALARFWETKLEITRSTLRNQVLHHDFLAVLEHPEDWSSWRVQNKFEAMRTSWVKDNGMPQGFVLLNPDGRVHTSSGDTTRASDVVKALRKSDGLDAVLLSPASGMAGVLGVQFYLPNTIAAQRPARIIALLDPKTVFTTTGEVPTEWTLLAEPQGIVLASASRKNNEISEAAWTLMVSQRNGAIAQPSGTTLCFARIQIPGMSPLLLLQTVQIPSAAIGSLIGIFSFLGSGFLLVLALRRRRDEKATQDATPAAIESETTNEAAGYRQIVQNISDPICVIDASGIVIKANRAAGDWLRLRRSKPDETITVQTLRGEFSARDFFSQAGEDPAVVNGVYRITMGDSVFEGMLEASRLYRDEGGRSAVLLHFKPLQEQIPPKTDHDYAPPELETGKAATLDSYSPFPVLAITSDGLVNAFNDAARRTCPRLDDTPLLTEILPDFDISCLSTLLDHGNGTSFQSLFGPRSHEFTIAVDGDRILLYGHPLADSQDLEIQMKQAQENFYSLCALTPSPVLLVDPRDHSVMEANAAAGDLFRMPAANLRGQTLSELSTTPWDLGDGSDYFIAQALDGSRIECTLRYELIKVEGLPELMIVLEPMPQRSPEYIEAPLISEVEPQDTTTQAIPPSLPVGPGMLVTLNPTVREVARRLFEKRGHSCEAFTNLDDAVVWLITHDVRPEFLAIDLTDFDEVDNWINDLRARCGDVPCIAFTDGDIYPLPNGGLNAFLPKPFDLDSLTEALANVNVDVNACSEVYMERENAD